MKEQKNSDVNDQKDNLNSPSSEPKVKESKIKATKVEAKDAMVESPSDDVDMAEQPEDETDVAAQLAAAQEEIAKLKDSFLRAKAEEDNVRRRAEKDVANSRKFAVEGFAKEMVNVYDSLKLACAVEVAADADATVKSIHEGVEITLKQLSSAFGKFTLKEIAPELGDKLDPNLHQAMSMVDSEDIDSGCVINVIQVGFELHDRLLRPAMVIVAK